MILRIELASQEVRTWRIPPVKNARHAWQERACLLLSLRDQDGVLGVGEAAPLAGYSEPWDTLDSVRSTLACLPWPLVVDTDAPLLSQVPGPGATPGSTREGSARCALETAILNLVSKRRNLPVQSLLSPNPTRGPLAYSCVLDLDTVANRGLDPLPEGIRTFKFKLGQRPFPLELADLKKVQAHLPQGARIRLDANQSWKNEDLAESLEALSKLDIEFLEEPTDGPWPPHPLVPMAVPLAMDESLRGEKGLELLKARLAQGSCQVVVGKPMILGISKCMQLSALAEAAGAAFVVSHLFDGPTAGALYRELARSIQSAHLACGFGPGISTGPW